MRDDFQLVDAGGSVAGKLSSKRPENTLQESK